MRNLDPAATQRNPGVCVRVTGTDGTHTGYYNLSFGASGDNGQRLVEIRPSAAYLTSGVTSLIADPLDYHWKAFSADGSTLEGSTWDGTESQADQRPGTATESTTDSSFTSGRCGVGAVQQGSGKVSYFRILAIGTDGDAAPTGPVGGTIPTLSAPGVTELGSTSVRPQITLTF